MWSELKDDAVVMCTTDLQRLGSSLEDDIYSSLDLVIWVLFLCGAIGRQVGGSK